MNHTLRYSSSAVFVVLASTSWAVAHAGGGGVSPPQISQPFMIADCTVKTLDVKAMKFTCNDLAISVSARTVIRSANVQAKFSDLKVGKAVTVTYMISASGNLADSVTSP